MWETYKMNGIITRMVVMVVVLVHPTAYGNLNEQDPGYTATQYRASMRCFISSHRLNLTYRNDKVGLM